MRFATILLTASLTGAVDPCHELCLHDGPEICTDGSFSEPDDDGGLVCHNYFYLADPDDDWNIIAYGGQPTKYRVPTKAVAGLIAMHESGTPIHLHELTGDEAIQANFRARVSRLSFMDPSHVTSEDINALFEIIFRSRDSSRDPVEDPMEDGWFKWDGYNLVALVRSLYESGWTDPKAVMLPYAVALNIPMHQSKIEKFLKGSYLKSRFSADAPTIRQFIREFGLDLFNANPEPNPMLYYVANIGVTCPRTADDAELKRSVLLSQLLLTAPKTLRRIIIPSGADVFEASVPVLTQDVASPRIPYLTVEYEDESLSPEASVKRWVSEISIHISTKDLLKFEPSFDNSMRPKYLAVGRFLALCILYGIRLEIPMDVGLSAYLLNHPVSLWDIESTDPRYEQAVGLGALEGKNVRPDHVFYALMNPHLRYEGSSTSWSVIRNGFESIVPRKLWNDNHVSTQMLRELLLGIVVPEETVVHLFEFDSSTSAVHKEGFMTAFNHMLTRQERKDFLHAVHPSEKFDNCIRLSFSARQGSLGHQILGRRTYAVLNLPASADPGAIARSLREVIDKYGGRFV